MAPAAPTVIAERFEVVARLQDRGLGESWHCRDPRRNHGPVMVKLLRATGAAMPAALDELLTRTKHARHESILRVYDWGIWNGRPYVVYEFFEGMSLGDGLDRARASGELLPVELLRDAFDGITTALDAAHRAPKGLLHLGVDPSCVIMRRLPGKPLKLKVLDFGIAAWADPDPTAPKRSARALRCAPPEARDPTTATLRSDVFALGALGREMFATPPDIGDTLTVAGVKRHRDDVPAAVWAELSRATDLDPAQRHPTFAAFVDAMRIAFAQPVAVRAKAAEPATPARPARPTLPPLHEALTPASDLAARVSKPLAVPVMGPLPTLAAPAAPAAPEPETDTVCLVNAVSRPSPSPWDLGALRDERAEMEHEAASAWLKPPPSSIDETIVVVRPGPAQDDEATIRRVPKPSPRPAFVAQAARESGYAPPPVASGVDETIIVASDALVVAPTIVAGGPPYVPHRRELTPATQPQPPVATTTRGASWGARIAVALGVGAALVLAGLVLLSGRL